MKTWKPTLEVLEGRALMSGLWDPGPGGGTPVPTGPLGVPILAGKSDTDVINFETPGGAVVVGDEVVFLTQDHWDRGGFEDVDDGPIEGGEVVDLTPDDTPEPPGGGGGGGILGWLGDLFGGGKNKDEESAESNHGLEYSLGNNITRPMSSLLPGELPLGQDQGLFGGTSPTPQLKTGLFQQKSSNAPPTPAFWNAEWVPVTNIFQAQPFRATGGDGESAKDADPTVFGNSFGDLLDLGYKISIEFTGAGLTENSPRGYALNAHVGHAGVVDPTNPDVAYLRNGAGQQVSVPDGGTVLLGGVKAAGGVHETVDNDETITIHGIRGEAPARVTLVEVLVA